LIINNLNAYTIPYKFWQRFTLLIINDLNLYIRFFAVFGGMRV
jgi:hypothetical protein